jgi:hypothetical protein
MQSESPKCVEIDIRRLRGFVHKNRRVEVCINRSPRQRELFSDGVRAAAAAGRPKPQHPIEAELQAKLDTARQRLRQVVILGMKTWLPEETRKELAKVESYARGQVRVHHRILDRFRASPPP